jgi:hypothetical protein
MGRWQLAAARGSLPPACRADRLRLALRRPRVGDRFGGQHQAPPDCGSVTSQPDRCRLLVVPVFQARKGRLVNSKLTETGTWQTTWASRLRLASLQARHDGPVELALPPPTAIAYHEARCCFEKAGIPEDYSMVVSTPSTKPAERTDTQGDRAIPFLENGDRLTRAEFERRYEAMPNLKKAELIEGVVHVPSPVRQRYHGP